MTRPLSTLRALVRFDVARLRRGAADIEAIDVSLDRARRLLEARVQDYGHTIRAGGADGMQARAKALAVAELSRRAVISDLLRGGRPVALMTVMTVTHWACALRKLRSADEAHFDAWSVGLHLDAGRVSYRVLRMMHPELAPGLGLLTSAVVLTEFAPDGRVHALSGPFARGWRRAARRAGWRTTGRLDDVSQDELAVAAAHISAALRAGAGVLEWSAARARTGLRGLSDEAGKIDRALGEEVGRVIPAAVA